MGKQYEARQTIVAGGVRLAAGDVFDESTVGAGCLASMLRLGQAVALDPAVAQAAPADRPAALLAAKDVEIGRLKARVAELEAERATATPGPPASDTAPASAPSDGQTDTKLPEKKPKK